MITTQSQWYNNGQQHVCDPVAMESVNPIREGNEKPQASKNHGARSV
jgi:hypothetical protein